MPQDYTFSLLLPRSKSFHGGDEIGMLERALSSRLTNPSARTQMHHAGNVTMRPRMLICDDGKHRFDAFNRLGGRWEFRFPEIIRVVCAWVLRIPVVRYRCLEPCRLDISTEDHPVPPTGQAGIFWMPATMRPSYKDDWEITSFRRRFEASCRAPASLPERSR